MKNWLLDVLKIVPAVLISIGGAGSIIFAFSSWLGKVWANRILEQDKKKYNHELEELKTKFDKELEYYKSQIELAKLTLSRYSEYQFTRYNELWTSLVKLKITGEKLWRKVDPDGVLDFAIEIRRAKEEVLKNALLIEEEHYIQLNELLDEFEKYALGKYTLAHLEEEKRKNPSFKSDLADALRTYDIRRDNASRKDRYEKLMEKILVSFTIQLRKGLQFDKV